MEIPYEITLVKLDNTTETRTGIWTVDDKHPKLKLTITNNIVIENSCKIALDT